MADLKWISSPGLIDCVFVNKEIFNRKFLFQHMLVCSLINVCLNSWHSLSFVAIAVGQRTTLAPVPACREDFLRMKLTSFDKLLERTCCHIKNVRLCSETDQKSGNSGVAPDAA